MELFEQSVLNTRSVARPGDGIMKEFADRDTVAHPVPDINLDGRPMEGTTYLEPSALGVSLDSGLMARMSRPEPLKYSVLGMLFVARPVEALTETDTPERPALASQVNHGHSKFKLSAPPMLDPDQVENADADLPENSAPCDELGLEIFAIGCAVVSVGKRYPGSSSHGGNNWSTAGGLVRPRAGPRQ